MIYPAVNLTLKQRKGINSCERNDLTTRIEGFPEAKISEQVIAPALETTRSAAAYARSTVCRNLNNFPLKKKRKKEGKVK